MNLNLFSDKVTKPQKDKNDDEKNKYLVKFVALYGSNLKNTVKSPPKDNPVTKKITKTYHFMAGPTGLEPPTFSVTGRRDNQFRYGPK